GLTRRGVGSCDLEEAGADVDAHDLDAEGTERMCVAPRSTADVEDPHPRFEPESFDQEGNLLGGAFRERIAEVGAAEMIGEIFEPMIAGRGQMIAGHELIKVRGDIPDDPTLRTWLATPPTRRRPANHFPSGTKRWRRCGRCSTRSHLGTIS